MKNFKSLFFKYLKCKLGWTGSIPTNVGMPSTHRCTHISTKATTCRIRILLITWGVSQEEKEKAIHAGSKLINKEAEIK